MTEIHYKYGKCNTAMGKIGKMIEKNEQRNISNNVGMCAGNIKIKYAMLIPVERI